MPRLEEQRQKRRVEFCGIPHLAKNVRDMGHPSSWQGEILKSCSHTPSNAHCFCFRNVRAEARTLHSSSSSAACKAVPFLRDSCRSRKSRSTSVGMTNQSVVAFLGSRAAGERGDANVRHVSGGCKRQELPPLKINRGMRFHNTETSTAQKRTSEIPLAAGATIRGSPCRQRGPNEETRSPLRRSCPR
jgi:hypothetical protein